MPKKKARRPAPPIVAPLGPATNLRPAGIHESEKTYNRKKLKAALKREEDESGFVAPEGRPAP